MKITLALFIAIPAAMILWLAGLALSEILTH
jgi:hypothetical protein